MVKRADIKILLFDLLIYLLMASGQKTINFMKWDQMAVDTFAAYVIFTMIFVSITNYGKAK